MRYTETMTDLAPFVTKERLLDALRAAGANIKDEKTAFHCPFHQDGKTKSGGITQRKDGRWIFHCFGCNYTGDAIDIRAKLAGTTVDDLIRTLAPSAPGAIQRPATQTPFKATGNAPGDVTAAKGTSTHPAPENPATPQGTPKKPMPDKPRTVYPTYQELRAAVQRAFNAKAADDGLQPPKIVAEFDYANPDTGNHDLVVFRAEYPLAPGDTKAGKALIQTRQVEGGWAFGAPRPSPLYNRKGIRDAQHVVIVEGENKAKALTQLGIVATSAAGGANGVGAADFSPLAGKAVTLWRDNDPAGAGGDDTDAKGHTIIRPGWEPAVLEKLAGLKPQPTAIRSVRADQLGLARSGDVVDFLAALPPGTTSKERREAADAALRFSIPLGESGALEREMERAISGERYAIPWPWQMLQEQTRSLLPSNVTVLCGGEGVGKSLLILMSCYRWFKSGIKVALLEMEGTRLFWEWRLLAQLAGNYKLAQEEWCKSNPTAAREARAKYADEIRIFGERCLHVIRTGGYDPRGLIQWVKVQADAGAEVIAIDPVTAMLVGEFRATADLQFILDAKQAIADNGARLLIVTHPKQGLFDQPGLHNMKGGVAYHEFADSAVWLHNCGHKDGGNVVSPYGTLTESQHYDRVFHILKARNAGGAGKKLAYQFRVSDFSMIEVGEISRD